LPIVAALVMSQACDAKSEKEVRLADFLTEDMVEDAMPAVRLALEECMKSGASKLVLPGGVLRLRPEEAVEKYQFISNNDASLKKIAFDLGGMSDFTVEGNGTQLLFTGFISPFSLEDCRNVTIENLSIDFTRTFNSEGTITGTGNGWLEIDFPDNYICDIENGCLYFRDEEGITYPFSNMLEFDGTKREPAFMAKDIWLSEQTVRAEKMPGGNIRVFREDFVGTPGNVMVFGAAARYNPGFFVADSEGVTIRDVNLYHCGGLGVIAQCSRDIELNKLIVVPTPGTDRTISITADATHYVNCGGYIRMKDCVFESQKDDATNIHGLYMAVERVMAPDKALFRWRNTGQYGIDFIREGMELEFVDNEDLRSYASGTVKSVKKLNKECTEVTFTEPLPEDIESSHVVASVEYPEVLIKGCRMSKNRARGLLLGSRGKMVIEDNYFHIAGAAILFEGDANFWFEQSGVRNVIIRNNVFENGNYGYPVWGRGCIAVGTRILKKENCRYHKGILVEGNTFRVFDPRIASLYCVDGFDFKSDNTIEMTRDYEYRGEETRSFIYEHCDNIVIEQ
jgi:hypothetical protein